MIKGCNDVVEHRYSRLDFTKPACTEFGHADEKRLHLRSKHTNTVSLSSWVTWIASTC